MTTYTIKCKLVAKEHDILDYHVLVFETLENNCPFGHKYTMVTVFPNWESPIPDLGETGFLTYDDVIGGIDEYYDRELKSIVKYNFSNLIFKKFVKQVDSYNNKDIII